MRRTTTRLPLIAGTLAGAPLFALAADAAPDQPDMPAIVVTATRSAEPAFEVPASIDAVALDDPAADTPGINPSEYLAGIPGILARDRQNYAQDEQISIRGFGARSTFGVRGVRLYVDGIPATMPDGQGQVSNFSLDSAERIEVLRGPFSALYGNSSGGVVQIFTADGSGPPDFRGSLGGGSYGTWRAAADVRGSDGALGYNVDLSHFYTDNYRGHGRAERENGNAKLVYRFDDDRKFTLLANTVALPNADDPLGLTRAQFAADPRQPQAAAVQFDTRKSVHQEQGGAIYEQSLTSTQSIRVLGYYGERNVQQFQSIPVATELKPTSPGGVIGLDGSYSGADVRWSYRDMLGGRPFEVTAGANYDAQNQHRTGYNNYSGSLLGVQGALRRDEQDDEADFDQYVEAKWDFAERWSLTAGARHSDVRFDSTDHYITATSPDDSGHVDYSATTPVAGLLFRAADDWRLYASYGSGFETPTFNELGYRPDGSAGINFGLVPARSRNGEIGSKFWFGSGAEFDIALFQADTRHELAVDTSTGGRTTYQNIDRARRSGAEAKLVYPLAAAWRVEAAYTYLDASFRSSFLTCPAASTCTTPNTRVAPGARIPGVPRSEAYAALRYGGASGWNAALEAHAVSRIAANDLNTQFAPGYGLVDAAVGYGFPLGGSEIHTFLRLDDVAGRSYVGSVIVNESNGRYFEPGPGRTIFAGLRVDWGR
ncbi:MAG TPA: TonB-dependent receptor [Rudaea sp.]|nr:TonB-dependent receptor [Rudaea sp.]